MVFLAGIMPKEYIHHALFDHEDDIHPLYAKGELVITKKHNHCSFLSFEFEPYVAAEPHYIVFKEPVYYTGFVLPVYSFFYTGTHRVIALRGPPTMC